MERASRSRDASSAPTMDMAMKTELALARRLTRLTLALGASAALATAARAQDTPRLGYGSFGGNSGPDASAPASGGGQDGNGQDADAPPSNGRQSNRPQRVRTDVSAYLE